MEIDEIRQRAKRKLSADDYRKMSISEIAQIRMDVKRLLRELDALHEQLAAAIRDLESDEDTCRVCKFAIDGSPCYCADCDEEGADCEKCLWFDNPCDYCHGLGEKWEWRGPQKEKTKNDPFIQRLGD